jgi:ribonuclease HI
VLRSSTKMKWDIEQQKAFEDLKLYLKHLLTLSSPEQGEPLILYVSAMHSVVSGVLVVEKEITRDDKIAKQRFLVYFVSEVLTGSKKHYSKMEKIYYAVIMSARKLRHYFEAHTIKVLTNQLLNDIFGNRGSSNRISKWAMELLEYVVDFEKRSMIKYKILADFIAEWTEPSSLTEGIVPESPWLIYCDGAWGYTGVGIATMLISPSGIKPRYAARLQFTNEADKYMNNIAEYEAILLGLCKLRAIRVQTCILRIDSKIVASQIEKECITRKLTLEKYLGLVRRMENHFKGFTVEYIERSKNPKANELAKAAAHNTPLPADVFFKVVPDA